MLFKKTIKKNLETKAFKVIKNYLTYDESYFAYSS